MNRTPRRRTARRPGPVAAAALLVLTLLAVAACSKQDSADEQTPEDALAAAKTALDRTSGVHIALHTDELPKGVDGVMDADGVGTHDPAFDGDIKVLVNSLTVSVPVVAVNGKVYAKLPFTPAYAEIDPADYGAPDPADLLATDGGVSSWLTAATDVQRSGQVRDGEDVLTAYRGSLPGEAVASVIPSADATATFDAEFRLDDQGRLQTADVTGPFYGSQGDVDYTIDLSDYGTERDITKP